MSKTYSVFGESWDLVEEKDRTYKNLNETLGVFAHASAVRTSALNGRGIQRLAPVLLDLHARWNLRVATAKVNEVIQQAQRERPTARDASTLHYATQVSAGPPSFVIFGGAREPDAGYRRYLENRLRKEFGFQGVPLRLRFRARKNTGRSRKTSG